MKIESVAFLGRSKQKAPVRELLATAKTLTDCGIKAYFQDELARHCSAEDIRAAQVSESSLKDIDKVDLAFVLGGDGTFLRMAHHCIIRRIPLTGINLGFLGFLTDIASDDMQDAIMAICKGQYRLEKRFVLSVQVERDGRLLSMPNDVSCAVNDIVISRGEAGVLLGTRVHINKQYVYDLRADGLIIATPSGSTAYALSAGGPIVAPNLQAMVLVPLCPHALTHRPLTINSIKTTIELEITRSLSARLHVDGRTNIDLKSGDIIRVSRHPKRLNICHPMSYDYYKTLRQKLSWGS